MRDRNEFVQLIDRYRLGQAQRLALGLFLQNDCQVVRACLMLSEGRGKFTRPIWLESRELEVPASVVANCQSILESNPVTLQEFTQCRADLTRVLGDAIHQMVAVSGVHSKMLLTACISEPGVWISDYDGKRLWQPFCQSEQLSEETGLTIIDALPTRDLAAGGRGWPLGPLPAWLLFADRNQTIAEQPRMLVDWDADLQLTWLPESDGLDDELPAIRFSRHPGCDFEKALLQACGLQPLDCSRRDELGAQGKTSEPLLQAWTRLIGQTGLDRQRGDQDDALAGMTSETLRVMQTHTLGVPDLLRSLAVYLAREIQRFGRRHAASGSIELVMGRQLASHGLLVSELGQLPGLTWADFERMNYQPASLPAAVVAMTGLMHVDQMPTTIPWITGCEHPRVLGRLTPGSPGNWRRVIMEMGDCRPPVMKLREAV